MLTQRDNVHFHCNTSQVYLTTPSLFYRLLWIQYNSFCFCRMCLPFPPLLSLPETFSSVLPSLRERESSIKERDANTPQKEKQIVSCNICHFLAVFACGCSKKHQPVKY